MPQCTCNWYNAIYDFTSTHTSQENKVRAATALLYLNVCCCTGTYRTNPATVSSYAYSI